MGASVSATAPDREEPAARGGLGRSTAIFSLWTGASRVMGLVREIIAAALFGTQGAINAFVIAFQVPNLLRSLVADSAISAAFVPVYTKLQEQGRHEDARRLAGALLGLVSIGLGALTLAAVVLAPYFMPFFAPGLSDPLIDETVRLARLMFPIVVLLGLTGIVVAILQAEGRFGPTAFAPVLWNAVIIGSLVVVTPFLDDGDRILSYAIGVLVGTALQLAYVAVSLRGLGRFPISFGLGSPDVRRVLILMLPVTLGLGLINVNLSVDSIFATLVSDQAPRAIDAAFRLYLLPQGMFSVAIATVLFPTISRYAGRADIRGVRDASAAGLRQIFFVLVPAAAILLVLAEPIVRFVFQYGAFDAESTDLTSQALFAFSLGLVFNGASLLVIRTFFSLQLPWLPTAVAGGGVVLNLILDLLLYRPLGVAGIPLATSIASLVTLVALVVLLARRIGGLRLPWVVDGLARCTAAGAVAAVLAWSSWRVLEDALGAGFIAQAISLTVALLAASAAYAAACRALSVPELNLLARIVRPLR